MLENEDSVVTSLNELRKLKHERITRQTQSRAVVGAGRGSAALAVDPASEQMTPPPVSVSSLSQSQPAAFSNLAPHSAPVPFGNFAPQAAGYAAPPIIQTKTSYKAAVVVAILLVGGAGAGYVKLDGEMRAKLVAKDNAIRDAEQSRMQAVEMSAKAEVLARNNLRQCEDKLKAATALAPVPAAASVSAPAVVEKKAEKPAAASRVATRAASHKVTARPSRRAAADPAGAKKEKDDVPTIAKKKKLDNDPLAGLGKL